MTTIDERDAVNIRAATMLQRNERSRAARKQLGKQKKAAVTIQCSFRSSRARRRAIQERIRARENERVRLQEMEKKTKELEKKLQEANATIKREARRALAHAEAAKQSKKEKESMVSDGNTISSTRRQRAKAKDLVDKELVEKLERAEKKCKRYLADMRKQRARIAELEVSVEASHKELELAEEDVEKLTNELEEMDKREEEIVHNHVEREKEWEEREHAREEHLTFQIGSKQPNQDDSWH